MKASGHREYWLSRWASLILIYGSHGRRRAPLVTNGQLGRPAGSEGPTERSIDPALAFLSLYTVTYYRRTLLCYFIVTPTKTGQQQGDL